MVSAEEGERSGAEKIDRVPEYSNKMRGSKTLYWPNPSCSNREQLKIKGIENSIIFVVSPPQTVNIKV